MGTHSDSSMWPAVVKAEDLVNFGVLLASYTDLEELKVAVDKIVNSVGYDFYSIVARDLQSFSKDKLFFVHNYPAAWEDHYFAHNYFEVDPANTAIKHSEPIFKWTTSSDSEVIRSAKEFGICSGITIPVAEPGSKGCTSFSSAASVVDPDMEVNAYFISPYIYSAIVKILNYGVGSEEYTLTKREVESLKWVCDGKTSWEISIILGISERTVLFHLTNIQKKLNTTNRLQSVAKSIVMGLITP